MAPEWFNYRLDGVQTDYVDKQGNPTLLGNSVTEAESVGLALNQASCISCHNLSSVTAQGAEGIAQLAGTPPICPIGLPNQWPPPLGSPYIRRDFVWTFVVSSSGSPSKPAN